MGVLPINAHIGDVEQTFKSAALKRKPERMPDQALGAITANQVFAGDDLRFAGAILNLRRHVRSVLRKTFQFRLPQNFTLVSSNVLVEQTLIFALLQDEHERVGAQSVSDVRQINFAKDLSAFEHADFCRNRAALKSLLCQIELFVNLECAGVNAERFGVRSNALVFLNDYKINAVADQLTSERKSRGTGADDDYLRFDWCRHMSLKHSQISLSSLSVQKLPKVSTERSAGC